MDTIARMLKEIASNRPHRNTVRKIITLKDQKSYEACILELKKYGITPYKQIKSINMLCFHINGGDDALQRLKKHPNVYKIETDVKGRRPIIVKAPSTPGCDEGIRADPQRY